MMQTDILAKNLTASGVISSGPARLKAITITYTYSGTTPASVVITDGAGGRVIDAGAAGRGGAAVGRGEGDAVAGAGIDYGLRAGAAYLAGDAVNARRERVARLCSPL